MVETMGVSIQITPRIHSQKLHYTQRTLAYQAADSVTKTK